jgi:hypothetical protein
MPKEIKNPSKGAHVHLDGANVKGLLAIIKKNKTKRSLGGEANVAVQKYVHHFVDNGR